MFNIYNLAGREPFIGQRERYKRVTVKYEEIRIDVFELAPDSLPRIQVQPWALHDSPVGNAELSALLFVLRADFFNPKEQQGMLHSPMLVATDQRERNASYAAEPPIQHL
jgi:hypothetical protein